jgi:hypothetical protein
VIRAAALLCLLGILGLTLTWELMTTENTAESEGASAPRLAGPSRSPVGTTNQTPKVRADNSVLVDLAATIDSRPLFSSTRRPADEAIAKAPSGTPQDSLPRLSGVIVGPTGGRAIFAGPDGKSHTAAEGDTVGAFKIRSIAPGVVTLSGSQGERVLRPTFVTVLSQSQVPPRIDGAIPRRREIGR